MVYIHAYFLNNRSKSLKIVIFVFFMTFELYPILTHRREPPIAPDSDDGISLLMLHIPHTGQRLLQTCLEEHN